MLPLTTVTIATFTHPRVSNGISMVSTIGIGSFIRVMKAGIPRGGIRILGSAIGGSTPGRRTLGVPFSVEGTNSRPRPLVLISKGRVANRRVRQSVGPSVVRSVDILGSRTSATVCKSGTGRNMVLVALGKGSIRGILSLSTSSPRSKIGIMKIIGSRLSGPLTKTSMFVSKAISKAVSSTCKHFILLTPGGTVLHVSCANVAAIRGTITPRMGIALGPTSWGVFVIKYCSREPVYRGSP